MQAMDAKGDTVLDEKFEDKEKLLQSFEEALDNEEVKNITVNKDLEAKPKLQYGRKKYLEKKLRKLNRKVAEVQRELKEG